MSCIMVGVDQELPGRVCEPGRGHARPLIFLLFLPVRLGTGRVASQAACQCDLGCFMSGNRGSSSVLWGVGEPLVLRVYIIYYIL